MADWRLKPRAQRCGACGRPFAAGDAGHSLLMPEDKAYARRDLCPACFAALSAQEKAAASAAWGFTVPRSTAKRTTDAGTAHRATAGELLRTLVARDDPRDRGAIYVLALLLERGKQLIERQTTVDDAGLRLHLYEERGSGDLFSVAEPRLSAETLPMVQRQVADLLEHGVRMPARVLRRRRRCSPVYRVKRMHR